MGGVFDALKTMDYIEPDWNSLYTLCPKCKCIYDHLYDNGIKLFCSTLYNQFNDRDNIKVIINAKNVPGGNPAWTTTNPLTQTVEIAFNSIYCNESALWLTGALLHESIHSKLFDEVSQEYPTLRRKDILEILRKNTKTSDPSHETMAKKYIRLIAEALWEANGRQLTVDHYMFIAWRGAEQSGKELGLLHDTDYTHYETLHNDIGNEEINFCN